VHNKGCRVAGSVAFVLPVPPVVASLIVEPEDVDSDVPSIDRGDNEPVLGTMRVYLCDG
jgi:hypothetical protein